MSYVLSDASVFSGETRIKSVVSSRQKINLMSGAAVAQKVMSYQYMGACGFIVSIVVFLFPHHPGKLWYSPILMK